ncbi:MAG: metallophosphoesterase [Solirubrobacteraceae bacterium]|nr:metallophosphoesterase [Solirubrobacteraceae bacterium]
MRAAVLADLHGHLPEVPPCELLLLAGDLCPAVDHGVERQARWLDGPFRAWLEQVPAEAIVGIAGNHDFVFQREPELVPADLPWTYLQDSDAQVAGLTIWGSPWTPWFHDWAFNAPRDGGEAFLAELYAGMTAEVDVLLVHGPPRGFGDRTTAGIAAGSTALLDVIDAVVPKVCAFGHIHEARGVWARGATQLVNAAAVDALYELRPGAAVVVDL